MTQREAFEAWQAARKPSYPAEWDAWVAATVHASNLALLAPIKTSNQDQREACANWILGGLK